MYVYRKKPDSGGKIFMDFIKVLTNCLLIAEMTVFALMVLKKSIASTLLIPLLIGTVCFSIYVRQRHFVVAERLPTRLCLSTDRRNKHLNLSFKDSYLQPEMREPEGMKACRVW